MLTLPPLRARPEDIPLLANYFIDKYRNDVPQDIHGLSETARADLLNHARRVMSGCWKTRLYAA